MRGHVTAAGDIAPSLEVPHKASYGHTFVLPGA